MSYNILVLDIILCIHVYFLVSMSFNSVISNESLNSYLYCFYGEGLHPGLILWISHLIMIQIFI